MQIQEDRAEIFCGVRSGKTILAPLVIGIRNSFRKPREFPPISRPRPGHADLAGAIKLGLRDARDVSERASARETAARVAAGAFANHMLSLLGIEVLGYVRQIGNLCCDEEPRDPSHLKACRERSSFYLLDPGLDRQARSLIRNALCNGDTLGGAFEVRVFNLPPGIGSFDRWENRLDGNLARALMSIQTVKGVEIGAGFRCAGLFGSEFHDGFSRSGARFLRKTNNAGGIEGGMSNGEQIVLRAFCKPIPTLKKPLQTIDLKNRKLSFANVEPADVCVLPALSVIGEAVTGFEIAKAILQKFGADTFEEVRQRYKLYLKKTRSYFSCR
jgi:chorismate synthase